MFWLRNFGAAVFFVVLASVPGAAKDVTVTFNDAEQKALFEIFDAAVKAQGMQVAGNAQYLWAKLVAAASAAEAKKPEAGK